MSYSKGIFTALLFSFLSFTVAQATVLIFYTDANGVTHCEVRHDLDDCGFANVNPAVDCFPWFSMSGGSGTVVINNTAVQPVKGEGNSGSIKPPSDDASYDHYLVTETTTRKGTQVNIRKISAKSDTNALLKLASASGCNGKHKIVTVPAAKRNTMNIGGLTAELEIVEIKLSYGEILLDGVIFEIY